ncbi:leukocyte surface antigen CD53-like [Actinia tenebrosa]|uniref:Leukocyte surface antigen CD53-like n=1 Tax=Actinia tenebrosa TaxID=6105 RepID=A0A6P8IV10_ACTTE|nr:leukocyte surface antigen CD53-like [Actinia tenebrosa]
MVFMNKSTLCIRWTAFFLNTLIWIGGSIMLGLSIWVYSKETEFDHMASDKTASACYLALSVLLFVIGFLGSCAILLLKPSLLKIYFSFIMTILLAELSVSLYLYFEQDKIKGFVEKNWNATNDATRTLIQEKFECCSMDPVITSHSSSEDSSCYEKNADNTMARRRDCYTQLLSWVKRNNIALATSAVLVALIQVFLLASSCRLLATIDSGDRMIRQIKVRPLASNNELHPDGSTASYTPPSTPVRHIIERKEWAKLSSKRSFRNAFVEGKTSKAS